MEKQTFISLLPAVLIGILFGYSVKDKVKYSAYLYASYSPDDMMATFTSDQADWLPLHNCQSFMNLHNDRYDTNYFCSPNKLK